MKRAWKTLFVACAVVAASLAAAGSASAGAIITVNPATVSVAPGDTLTAEVFLTGGVNVQAYQVSVAYDPSVLSVTNVIDGTFLENFDHNIHPFGFVIYSPPDFTTSPGTVSFIAALSQNVVGGVSASDDLGTLHFTALTAGTTTITAFFDANNGDGLFAYSPTGAWEENPIDVQFGPVPEPVSMLSLAVGLGAVFERRRRRLSRQPTNR